MSRIGKLPVNIPQGVTITVDDGNTVKVKGPKGELSEKISSDMLLEQQDGVLTVKRPSDQKEHRSLHGLSRTLINNMVVGVTEGYTKRLDIVGVGYRAQKQGNKLVLNMGYSHPVEFVDDANVTYDAPSPNQIIVSGISKQAVGQKAAEVRGVRPPEPYKGKGIKYHDEYIRRKEGKTNK